MEWNTLLYLWTLLPRQVLLYLKRERERKKENACGLIELVLNETANVEQVNYVLLRVAPHIEF